MTSPRYSEDPREWRKLTFRTLAAAAVVTAFLCWRKVLPWGVTASLAALLALGGITALARPACLRRPYRVGMWLGHVSAHWIGQVALVLFFVGILTPLGWVLRGLGKHPLSLKPDSSVATYWTPSRKPGPLDRLF